MTGVLIGKGEHMQRYTRRRRPCKDRCRNYADAAKEDHRWMATSSSWKRQERLLPQRLWRECGPADTLTEPIQDLLHARPCSF